MNDSINRDGNATSDGFAVGQENSSYQQNVTDTQGKTETKRHKTIGRAYEYIIPFTNEQPKIAYNEKIFEKICSSDAHKLNSAINASNGQAVKTECEDSIVRFRFEGGGRNLDKNKVIRKVTVNTIKGINESITARNFGTPMS